MTIPDWQHSRPLPQPTRHRVRGRTDFEDSLLSARREEQAQEKRRLEAMTEALRARGLASDPQGKLFHAAQQKAIAARRAENARLAHAAEQQKVESGEFSISRLDAWDDAAVAHGKSTRRKPLSWLAALLVMAGICAAAGVAYPEVWRHLAGA